MQKFFIAHRTGENFIAPYEITHLKADGRYTHIFTWSGLKLTCCSTLKNFQLKIINTSQFFRVHRSYVINLGHVIKISKGRNAVVTLSNKMEIPVAETRKGALKKAIRQHFAT